MSGNFRLLIAAALVVIAACDGGGASRGVAYPQFLGPHRDATLPDVRLERDWQAHPPRELWRRPVGAGWSSFAVDSGFAVTQEQRGEAEWIVAYDVETGRELWSRKHARGHETDLGGAGPRATPTITAGRVFALSATGVLTALRLEDGTRLWSENLIRRHGAAPMYFGQASSPLAVGDRIVVAIGGRRGETLVAYEQATGELAWSSGRGRVTYSSPTLLSFTVGGAGSGEPVEQIVVLARDDLAGFSTVDGEPLWSTPWPEGQPVAGQPLALPGNRILVSAGYGVGSKVYEIQARRTAGEIEYEASLVWEAITLKSKASNYVLCDGVVYGLDGGILVAIDPDNGSRFWKAGRFGDGQLLLVGDLLLLLDDEGTIHLLEPNRSELRELASLAVLDGRTHNHPVLAGRRLLVRNATEAAGYEVALER